MEKERSLNIIRLFQYLIPIVLIVAVSYFVVFHSKRSISLLEELHQNRPIVTVVAFWGLYLLKSVSFGLPFMVLYAAVGALFPLGWALLINICGILINMQIPYLFGRYAGQAVVQKVIVRFPKLQYIERFSHESAFTFSFMVKFIAKIPHEITNLFLGSLKVPYASFITGGLVGLLPTMATATYAGVHLSNPTSLEFIISFSAFVIITLGSLFLFKRR
ncbi:MAG: TVP38/TMEM64 family protein [Sphaerochaetaceae bacterium]